MAPIILAIKFYICYRLLIGSFDLSKSFWAVSDGACSPRKSEKRRMTFAIGLFREAISAPSAGEDSLSRLRASLKENASRRPLAM